MCSSDLDDTVLKLPDPEWDIIQRLEERVRKLEERIAQMEKEREQMAGSHAQTEEETA